MPRGFWLLGSIVKVFPGHDTIVRSSEVKTKFSVMKRPVTKLPLLKRVFAQLDGSNTGKDVTDADCNFLFLIGFDITWTLQNLLSKKLCNPDVGTRVWSCRILAWTYGKVSGTEIILFKAFLDQYQYLGNCASTPPLTQHVVISQKVSVTVGLGEG